VPQPVICLGSASFYLALLATAMSRWEAGCRFQAAVSAHDRLGARTLLARSQYEHARMLIRRSRAADRSRPAADLDEANSVNDPVRAARAGDSRCAR
jgi:hypothetical protein